MVTQPSGVSTYRIKLLKKKPTKGVYQKGIFFNSNAMYINAQLNTVSILITTFALRLFKKINKTTTSSANL